MHLDERFRNIISLLPDGETTFHSPASISDFALTYGMVHGSDPKEMLQQKRLVSITCRRIIDCARFPETGDGQVQLDGQAPLVAWKKERWEKALEKLAAEEVDLSALPERPLSVERTH